MEQWLDRESLKLNSLPLRYTKTYISHTLRQGCSSVFCYTNQCPLVCTHICTVGNLPTVSKHVCMSKKSLSSNMQFLRLLQEPNEKREHTCTYKSVRDTAILLHAAPYTATELVRRMSWYILVARRNSIREAPNHNNMARNKTCTANSGRSKL